MGKDPFEPIWGAWVLLLCLIGMVVLGQLYIFLGCILGREQLCARSTENLTSVSVEVLAAVAQLISLGRK
jgi:hypothetical protein